MKHRSTKHLPIAKAAAQSDCSETTLRRLDRIGVVHPIRDPWGRRLFGDDDVSEARAYLARERSQNEAAA